MKRDKTVVIKKTQNQGKTEEQVKPDPYEFMDMTALRDVYNRTIAERVAKSRALRR